MSTLSHFGKGALRTAKNYTKGYSDTQAKVREATSNDPWGPSGTQMNELAQLTYNQTDFVEIMEMLDKRLNDKGKNWRHVFKALTVLDYLLHAGSENVVIYFKDNIYVVKTLKEFQFIDEDEKDQGANVRQKAKDITNLLQDDARLRLERKSRASMRDRLVNGREGEEEDFGPPRRSTSVPPVTTHRRPKDDDEMRRAIEESKRSLEQEQARQKRNNKEETELEMALRISREEEANRNRALEDANSRALFDDQNQLISFGDPQPNLQPQFTSFNPYALQMQQQQLLQEEQMRQQQAQLEWERQQQQLALQQQQQQAQEEFMRQQHAQAQQDEFMRQQQAQQLFLQQQQQAQQQALFDQQQQQQYLQQQQQQQHQPIQAQPTGFGSKNPFAFQQQQQQASSPPPPSLPNFSASAPDLHAQQYQSPQRFNSIQEEDDDDFALVANTQANARRPYDDGKHAHLAGLIGNRAEDGIDTFGNIGQLRYGHTGGGRQNTLAPLVGQRTGTGVNPFASMSRQQTLGGQPTGQNPDQPFFSI